MKTNLIIIGENSQINKSVGQVLAEMLELNYLDFDGYCDYINLVSRDKVIQIYGKRKYNELQKETLPQMRVLLLLMKKYQGYRPFIRL